MYKINKFLRLPLIIFLIAILVQFFYHITGVRKISNSKPKDLIEILNLIPEILTIAVIIAFLLWLIQKYRGKPFEG
jgi:amino acid transporter